MHQDTGTSVFPEKVYINAHRMAYELSYGTIFATLCVCHHCDTKLCCRPDHLFLGTYADNIHDCINKGRRSDTGIRQRSQGEGNVKAVLTAAQVLHIRTLRGILSGPNVAEMFGVTHGTIYAIWREKTWRHLL